MNRRTGIYLSAFAVMISILLSACGGSSRPAVSVSVAQTGSSTMLAGGAAVTVTATVTNDSTNAGVKWSLTSSPSSVVCGTLSSSTTTTATYAPPAEALLTAQCKATITATSVTDGTKDASTAETVNAISISLPSGESTTPTVAAGESGITLAASAVNDASGSATLNWNISGVLSSAAFRPVATRSTSQGSKAVTPTPASAVGPTSPCGSLSASTGTSVGYNPPIAGTGACTATVTVSTSVNSSVSQTFTITVNPTLAIVTSSLPAGNYDVAYAPTTLTVSGGVAPYTWAATGLPPGMMLSPSGVLSGTPSAAGSGTYNFSVTDSSSTPYKVNLGIPLSVNKAPVTVAASSPTVTYGASVPSITPTFAGFATGDSSSVLTTQPTCSTTYTTSSAVGSSSSTSCSGAVAANYTFSYTSGHVTVNQASVSVTASSPTVGYGAAVPTVTPSFSGFVNGETSSVLTSQPVCTTAYTPASNVGSLPSTSCSGAVATNYTLNYIAGHVTVTPASATALVTASSKPYDGTISAQVSCTLSGSPANVGCTANGPNIFSQSNVGTNLTVTANTITLTGSAAGNYTLGSATATTTASITPVGLTVIASSPIVGYGAATPTITPSFNGFVTGETSSVLTSQPVCTTAYTTASNVGSSPATSCSGAVATNYTLSYTAGHVNVTPASVSVTASSPGVTYGAAVPTIIPNFNGFMNGQTSSVLTSQPICTTAYTTASNVGSSNPTSCSGAVAANYTFTYIAGNVTVDKAISTVTVDGSVATPFTYGTQVTYTATVTPSGGTETGTVTFKDGGATLGIGTLSGGTATYTTSTLVAGNHSIVAVYNGDANYNGNVSSTLSFMVNKATAAITTPPLATAITYGQALSFSTLSGGSGTPAAGTFTFTAPGTIPPSVGTYSAGLTYTPSDIANYNPATGTVNVTVNKASTTTTVTASVVSPSTYGTQVIYTATVTPSAGTETGTVTFQDGGIPLGSGALSGGTATYTTSTLAAGSHSITAVYSGDANYNGGSSLALSFVVNKATAVITDSPSATAIVYGQALSFSTLSGGTATPAAGTFAFTAPGTIPPSTGTYSAGVTYTPSDLANYNTTTGTVNVTVNKASTTTTVSASVVSPSTYGTPVTYTAVVVPSTATGTVTFQDGVTLGSGALSGGTATFTTSTLPAASHSITAVYNGDTNYSGSSSSALPFTVNKATAVFSVQNTSMPVGQASTPLSGKILSGSLAPSGIVTASVSGYGACVTPASIALDGSFSVACTTSSFAVGTYTITYTYPGDTNFNSASNNSTTLTVNAAPIGISTASLPNGVAGTPYLSPVLAASGGTPPYTWSIVSGAPAGISLNANNALSGTVATPSSNNPVVVKVVDSGIGLAQQSTTKQLSLTFNPALVIGTNSPLPTGNTGVPYSQQLTSSGGVGTITWSYSGSLPTGMGVNGAGLLSGTPTASGPYTFTAQAMDSGSPQQIVTKQLSFTINPGIYITLSPNTPPINVDAGTAGGNTLQITATVNNDASGQGVNFSSTNLCGGSLSQPTTNVLSVTYTAPTTISTMCTVSVTAVSVTSPSQTAQVSFNVNFPLTLPPAPLSSLGTATATVAYNNGFINAGGGVAPYTWTITGLSSNGFIVPATTSGNTLSITGTPTIPGSTPVTVPFNVTIKDAVGAQVGPVAYSITINPYVAVSLPAITLPTAYQNVSGYQAYINAQNGAQPYTWSVNGNLPAGLTGSIGTGSTFSITGTPTGSVGNVLFTVNVTDGAGKTASQGYSISVATPIPLAITTTANDFPSGAGVGLPYTASFQATGGSNNFGNYVFSTPGGGLPQGLSWSSTCNSCIVGTPSAGSAGSYPFTVQVTDSTIPGSVATQSFTIVVSAVPSSTVNNAYLYGHYAFLFRGFVDNPNSNGGNSALYQTAAIGSFQADGLGNISNGRFNVNDGNGKNGNGSDTNGFTGTYSIGPDNRGILYLSRCVSATTCSTATQQVFAFSVGQIETVSLTSGTCPTGGDPNDNSCPVYTEAGIVEIDDAGTTPSGVHGTGRLLRQNLGQFNTLTNFQANVAGNWVFGFEGEDTAHTPLGSAGVFTLQSGTLSGSTVSGNISFGETDINDNGTVNITPFSLSGADTYTSVPATTGNGWFNGTLTIPSAANPPTGYPTNYKFFMVSSNKLVGMSFDPHNQYSLVSGILYKQQASHTSMPAAFVMYMGGASGGNSSTDAFIGQLSCGSGNPSTCTINSSDENDAGNYTHNDPKLIGSQLSALIDPIGRVGLGGNGTPVFYLYDSSSTGGGVVLSAGGIQVGNLESQGTIPSLGALDGSYYMRDLFAMSADGNSQTGALTISGGNINLTQDTGAQGGTNYAGSMSGMAVSSPATAPSDYANYGVFDINAGGATQVVCYLIHPVCTAGEGTCGPSSSPYGMSACVGTHDGTPKVTLIQQVQ